MDSGGGRRGKRDPVWGGHAMPLLEPARRFFDALNTQELGTVTSMIAPNADIRTPIGEFT